MSLCPRSFAHLAPTAVPSHHGPQPHCGALTLEEAARVQQLAGALALQLVGQRAVQGQRTAPVHGALPQALGENALGRHPQQHAALQVTQQVLQQVRTWWRLLREAHVRHTAWGPQQALGSHSGSLRAGSDRQQPSGRPRRGLAHQRRAAEEPRMQPAVCGCEERRAPVGTGGAADLAFSASLHNEAEHAGSSGPLPICDTNYASSAFQYKPTSSRAP